MPSVFKAGRLFHYAISVGVVVLAVEVTRLLDPYLTLSAPFIFCIAAIMGIAWLCGLRPALLGIGLCALLFDYWFTDPRGSLQIGWTDLAALAVFTLETTVIVYFIDNFRRTHAEVVAVKSSLEEDLQHRQKELLKTQEHVRRLMSDLTVAEARERRELATELHDYLTQLLVVARMSLKQAVQHPATSSRALHKTDDLLHQSIDYARSLMVELYPPQLYESGLPAALQALARQMLVHDLAVSFKKFDDAVTLSKDEAELLYRATRELLMNVVKHAAVREAAVILTLDSDNTLCISVRDRGKGFDSMAPIGSGKGFGLASIQERLIAAGGRVVISTQPGQGTTVILFLPVASAATRSFHGPAPVMPNR